MNVIINGTASDVERATTVAALLVRLGHEASGKGVAVALNGRVVPRAEWADRRLEENDHIEILSAIGGG